MEKQEARKKSSITPLRAARIGLLTALIGPIVMHYSHGRIQSLGYGLTLAGLFLILHSAFAHRLYPDLQAEEGHFLGYGTRTRKKKIG